VSKWPPYVLWLEWCGFYADDGLARPQVVVRERRVLDANSAAQRRGVNVGMSVQEARNIVPDLVRKPWHAEEYVARQRAWLDQCLAFSHRLEPIDAHLAALDLTDHPRPQEIAQRLTEVLQSAVRLPLRYGAGPSKWMAALAARSHDLRTAVEDPAAFLAPMPIERLVPVEPAHRERLAFLGYRKVGDVARLPLEVLQAQFGEAAWRIVQAARGTLSDPVVDSYPPDGVAGAITFDGPPDTVQALEEGLSRLASELAEKLAKRNSVGKRVELCLEYEEGPETRVARTFARSLATSRDLFCAMRLLLVEPPARPVERVRVLLPDLIQARRVQMDIHDRRARADAEESRRAAVMHVRTVFGDGAVRQGSEIAVPRWMLVRRAYRDALGWVWI